MKLKSVRAKQLPHTHTCGVIFRLMSDLHVFSETSATLQCQWPPCNTYYDLRQTNEKHKSPENFEINHFSTKAVFKLIVIIF